MLKGKTLFTALLLLNTLGLACANVHTDKTSSWRDYLLPLPGAQNVRFSSSQGSEEVGYELPRAQSPIDAASALSLRLEKKGWKPRKTDFLNPSSQTYLFKWIQSDVPNEPSKKLDQWFAQWNNTNGDVLFYEFSYHHLAGMPGASSEILVSGVYYPSAVAINLREKINSLKNTYSSSPSRITPEKSDSKDLNIMLIALAENGQLHLVKLLLKNGADVNSVDEFKYTPLMKAAQYGHFETVLFLLKAGANVNSRTSQGASALSLAAENGHTEIVNVLVEKGADFSISVSGYSPLDLARRNGHVDVVRLLERAMRMITKDK